MKAQRKQPAKPICSMLKQNRNWKGCMLLPWKYR